MNVLLINKPLITQSIKSKIRINSPKRIFNFSKINLLLHNCHELFCNEGTNGKSSPIIVIDKVPSAYPLCSYRSVATTRAKSAKKKSAKNDVYFVCNGGDEPAN